MYRYIARANIDHFLGFLNDADLAPERRAVIVKLLIEEEDKLGHDLEQLQFAETRAANGRNRVNRTRELRDTFVEGSIDRERADKLLVQMLSKLAEPEDHTPRVRGSARCRPRDRQDACLRSDPTRSQEG